MPVVRRRHQKAGPRYIVPTTREATRFTADAEGAVSSFRSATRLICATLLPPPQWRIFRVGGLADAGDPIGDVRSPPVQGAADEAA
jgi:hypothetical protein